MPDNTNPLTQLSDGLAEAVEVASRSTVLVSARRRFPASGVAWSSDGKRLTQAAQTYEMRREALRTALCEHGFETVGRSGFNLWLPVAEETPVVQALAASGWAVAAGERFRIKSAPGIRITVSTLEPEEAKRLASDIAGAIAEPVRLCAV